LTIFGEAVVTAFVAKHADARAFLTRFLAIAGAADWRNFPELKQSLPSADIGRGTRKLIINVCYNKYRLIADVDFEAQELNIEYVLTHEECNREKL
jgi:mRNA interferase HigB